MAAYTAAEKSRMSEAISRLVTVDYPKARIFSAADAVQTYLDLSATKTAISQAINTATGAPNLSVDQKQKIVAYCFIRWAEKELGL